MGDGVGSKNRAFARFFVGRYRIWLFLVAINDIASRRYNHLLSNSGCGRPAMLKPTIVCVALSFIVPMNVVAGGTLQGRNWAGACTGCHGTEGRSVGHIPSIAGMEKSRFAALMYSFRQSGRRATVMHQHAKGLSEAQIDALGDYFASRDKQR